MKLLETKFLPNLSTTAFFCCLHYPFLVLMIRYEVYGIRWLVLLSVTLLNLSNNALWISYASVAPVSADYFDKDINTDIDLLSTISFYVGIPMCIISTYVVDALGFKTGQLLDENKGKVSPDQECMLELFSLLFLLLLLLLLLLLDENKGKVPP